MNREQATYGIGGVVFGFASGFVLAYALTAPTQARHAGAPVPAARSAQPAPGSQAVAPGEGIVPADGHDDIMSLLAGLNRRLEENPGDIGVLMELAQIYLRAGMAEQALEYLSQVMEQEPGHYQARLYTAMAMEATGRGDVARQKLEEMVAEDPLRWEPHYMLALHYLHGPRDLARAQVAIGEVERLNPEMPSLPGLREEAARLEADLAAAGGPG